MPEATIDLTVIPDVALIPWRPIVAGLHARSLHVDPATGARVALIRMAPDEGYSAPQVAHYHETYEEIVGLRGRFTFDSETWLEQGGYVLHPAGTVHGFASQVVADTVTLSRVGPGHKAILVPEPAHRTMYAAPGFAPTRKAAAMAQPLATVPPTLGRLLGAPADWHILAEMGEGLGGAAFVALPAHWRAPGGVLDTDMEIFVLTGILEIAGEPVGGPDGGFARAPRGTRWPALSTAEPCLLFVAQGTPEPIA